MKISKHIPNFITCLNLLSGCIAVTFAAQSQFTLAAYCIFLAAIFDFFDGFMARLLKAHSDIGLQLDSMADMVSFGFAPSAILYYYLSGETLPCPYVPYCAFLIAIFSALRLAKFNIDTRQSESFIGLPTPSCAILIASVFLYNDNGSVVLPLYGILVGIVVLSYLLIAEIPMFSLKVKKTPQFVRVYAYQIILVVSSLLFILAFDFGGLALAILWYILLSAIKMWTKAK